MGVLQQQLLPSSHGDTLIPPSRTANVPNLLRSVEDIMLSRTTANSWPMPMMFLQTSLNTPATVKMCVTVAIMRVNVENGGFENTA